MKRILTACAALFALSAALLTPALAADDSDALYPTSITVSEDGTELRKIYDLSPESDPAGIPRSDFELDGFSYTFVDILRQELPQYEERQYTETVTVNSEKKDMESVLSLLPQEREVVTEDGLTGVLSLKLDTVRVEVAGYGSSIKTVTATRTYPDLDGQDTSYIPKTVEDNGRTLTLQAVAWEMIGVEGSERYTATATYVGTAQSSYVSGYVVTADYAGTVSRINLNKVRYVAIFSGVSLTPTEPDTPPTDPTGTDPTDTDPTGPDQGSENGDSPSPTEHKPSESVGEAENSIHFPWGVVFGILGGIGLALAGAGVAISIRRRSENRYYDDNEENEEDRS